MDVIEANTCGDDSLKSTRTTTATLSLDSNTSSANSTNSGSPTSSFLSTPSPASSADILHQQQALIGGYNQPLFNTKMFNNDLIAATQFSTSVPANFPMNFNHQELPKSYQTMQETMNYFNQNNNNRAAAAAVAFNLMNKNKPTTRKTNNNGKTPPSVSNSGKANIISQQFNNLSYNSKNNSMGKFKNGNNSGNGKNFKKTVPVDLLQLNQFNGGIPQPPPVMMSPTSQQPPPPPPPMLNWQSNFDYTVRNNFITGNNNSTPNSAQLLTTTNMNWIPNNGLSGGKSFDEVEKISPNPNFYSPNSIQMANAENLANFNNRSKIANNNGEMMKANPINGSLEVSIRDLWDSGNPSGKSQATLNTPTTIEAKQFSLFTNTDTMATTVAATTTAASSSALFTEDEKRSSSLYDVWSPLQSSLETWPDNFTSIFPPSLDLNNETKDKCEQFNNYLNLYERNPDVKMSIEKQNLKNKFMRIFIKSYMAYNAKMDFNLDIIKKFLLQYDNIPHLMEWNKFIENSKKMCDSRKVEFEERLNSLLAHDLDNCRLVDNCLDLLFEQYIFFMKNDGNFMRLLVAYNDMFALMPDKKSLIMKKYQEYLSDLNKLQLKKSLFADNQQLNISSSNNNNEAMCGLGGDQVATMVDFKNLPDSVTPSNSVLNNNRDMKKEKHDDDDDVSVDGTDTINTCPISNVKVEKSVYVHHYCPMVSALNTDGMILTLFNRNKVPKRAVGGGGPSSNVAILESVESELNKSGLNGRIVFDCEDTFLHNKCYKRLVVRLKQIFPQLPFNMIAELVMQSKLVFLKKSKIQLGFDGMPFKLLIQFLAQYIYEHAVSSQSDMKSTNLSCSKASSVTKGVLWSKVAAAAQSPAAATSCSNIPSPCSSSSNQNSLTSGSGSQKKLVSTDSKVATNESREPQQQSFSPFAIKICLLCKTPIKFFDNNGEQVTLKSAGNRAQMTLCNHIFHKECLDFWCQKSSNCPICNQFILRNEEFPSL